MWSRAVKFAWLVVKETILLISLSVVLNTMVAGVLALAIYNVPQSVWNAEGVEQVLFVFIVAMAPIFTLARVIEWWINLYLSPNPPKRCALALTPGLMGKGWGTGQAGIQ